MIAFDQLHKQISDSQNILLLCHQNPDGDTLGAAGALAFFISSAGHKKACIHCPDALPENFQFLKIKKFFTSQKPVLSDFDLLIFIDCAVPRRSGLPAEFEEVKEKIYSVNIDHHATNPSYANLNIIEAQASSTC